MGRTRWHAARRHLTLVGDGGLAVAGAPETTFRTAPLPDGAVLKLWEDCGCDYPAPAGVKKDDPAWAEWTEEPPRAEDGKQSLRLALTRAPSRNHPGGLLGPNFYALGHFHSGDARREQPGFPDLMIWTPRDVPNEAWELKKMGENPTLPQAHHMTVLELAGFRVRTVRPCCLLSGWIDRWLGVLAGREATLSQWAPKVDTIRPVPRPAGQPVGATAAPARPARPSAVVDPPGLPVDDTADGDAVAYLIPMPDAARPGPAVTEIEDWLRTVGFPPYTVPWPMRIVVGGPLVVVWVNTGEPGRPGKPRPRTWRSSYLDRPFPAHVVAALAGDARHASSLRAAMTMIAAEPATVSEETC